MFGFECTLGVAAIDETIAAVEANGGKIVMPEVSHFRPSVVLYFSRYGRETSSAPLQYD